MAKKVGRSSTESEKESLQVPVNEDFTIPVWMSLGTRFYELLNRLAVRENMLRSDVLMESLRLFSRKTKVTPLKQFFKSDAAAEAAFRKFVGEQSKKRWESKSDEERRAWGAHAANARWERARKRQAEEAAVAQQSKSVTRKKKPPPRA